MRHIRYRNHDVDITFSQAQGILVHVDGVLKAQAPTLQKLIVPAP